MRFASLCLDCQARGGVTQPSQEQRVPSEESKQRPKHGPCGKHFVFMGLCLVLRIGDGSPAGCAGLMGFWCKTSAESILCLSRGVQELWGYGVGWRHPLTGYVAGVEPLEGAKGSQEQQCQHRQRVCVSMPTPASMSTHVSMLTRVSVSTQYSGRFGAELDSSANGWWCLINGEV